MAIKEISEDQLIELLCISQQESGFGGYKRELLVQNLSVLEENLVVCPKCKGIMRDASVWNGLTSCFDCSENSMCSSKSDLLRDNIAIMQTKCPLYDRGCP